MLNVLVAQLKSPKVSSTEWNATYLNELNKLTEYRQFPTGNVNIQAIEKTLNLNIFQQYLNKIIKFYSVWETFYLFLFLPLL